MFSINGGEVINLPVNRRSKDNSENSNPNLDQNGPHPKVKNNGSQISQHKKSMKTVK
jgi:hypothetical protein